MHFTSANLVDVVLVVMLIEAGWLIWRGAAPIAVLLMLVPGALMLVALRVALTGQNLLLIAALLTASLPVHLTDLRRRRLT